MDPSHQVDFFVLLKAPLQDQSAIHSAEFRIIAVRLKASDQVAKLTEANKLIAEDAAGNWLYLYPQIVVSAANVTGYPVNGLNSQFFAYGIKKAK